MSLEELKTGLRRLPPQQLHELRRYIDGLLMLPGGRVPVPGRRGKASWILQVLDRECEGLAIGRASISDRARKAVNLHSPDLEAFFVRAMPTSPLSHRRLVLATGIRLVYARMSAQGLAVSPALLASNLGSVPAVLDRAYPGYARLGALWSIVNAGDRPIAPAAGRGGERTHSIVSESRARQARKQSSNRK